MLKLILLFPFASFPYNKTAEIYEAWSQPIASPVPKPEDQINEDLGTLAYLDAFP